MSRINAIDCRLMILFQVLIHFIQTITEKKTTSTSPLLICWWMWLIIIFYASDFFFLFFLMCFTSQYKCTIMTTTSWCQCTIYSVCTFFVIFFCFFLNTIYTRTDKYVIWLWLLFHSCLDVFPISFLIFFLSFDSLSKLAQPYETNVFSVFLYYFISDSFLCLIVSLVHHNIMSLNSFIQENDKCVQLVANFDAFCKWEDPFKLTDLFEIQMLFQLF